MGPAYESCTQDLDTYSQNHGPLSFIPSASNSAPEQLVLPRCKGALCIGGCWSHLLTRACCIIDAQIQKQSMVGRSASAYLAPGALLGIWIIAWQQVGKKCVCERILVLEKDGNYIYHLPVLISDIYFQEWGQMNASSSESWQARLIPNKWKQISIYDLLLL